MHLARTDGGRPAAVFYPLPFDIVGVHLPTKEGTMTFEELEKMVVTLHDRQAIYDCIMTYSRGVDRLDREALLSIYHEDGIDDHGVFIGTREEFADWVEGMHRSKQFSTQHCLFNHTCDLDGDVAHTETYFMYAGMNKQGQGFSMSGGRYLDRLEKRDGKWAIVVRKCVRDWIPAAEVLNGARQVDLTAGRAFLEPHELGFLESFDDTARDRTDPSYDRPLTVDPERLDAWRAATAEPSTS